MIKEYTDFLRYESRYGLKVLIKDMFTIGSVFNSRYINKILSYAAKHNQRYTFFLRTKNLHSKQKLINTLLNSEHEIGCHGYNHLILTNLSKEQFKEEIKNSISVFKTLGLKLNGFRAPFLESNSIIQKELKFAGFKYCSDIKTTYQGIQSYPVYRPFDWEAIKVKNWDYKELIKQYSDNSRKVLLLHPYIIKNFSHFIRNFKGTDFRICNNPKTAISFDIY